MRADSTARPIEILMVEDNPADARLTLETFRELKLLNQIHSVTNGEAALAFLRKEGQYAAMRQPDLVLLDLNLPGMKGAEVLAEMKSDPDLEAIPVVVLTGSSAEADILRAHDLHACGYITKPVELKEFGAILNFVEDLGLQIVKQS